MGAEGFPGDAAVRVPFGTSGAAGTSAGDGRFSIMPSTVIRRFAFRPVEAALDVEFTTGRVYRYFAVPEPVARRLAESRS